jgi:hypothetical protein
MVMDDRCQFHHDAKHTMRECEQLKRAYVNWSQENNSYKQK